MSEQEKEDLLTAIHRMDKRGERIERILLGDEQAEQEGLVHKVKAHGKYIDNDKRLKAKIAGGVAVGTPLLVILWDRIQHWLGWK